MCNDHPNEPGTFRDREFDSHVRQAVEQSAPVDCASAVKAPYNGPGQNACGNASTQQFSVPPVSLFAAVDGALEGIAAAREIADKATNELLEGYYFGSGKFDHARFLNDLETKKGSELTIDELRFFARAAGSWVGDRVIAESRGLTGKQRAEFLINALFA